MRGGGAYATCVALVLVAGTSIATVLFLGTTGLYVAYDGSPLDAKQFRTDVDPLHPTRGVPGFERTVAAHIVEHWLAVFVWLGAVVHARDDVLRLPVVWRNAVWYAAFAAPLGVWMLVLRTWERTVDHGHGWYDTPAFAAVGVAVAAAPWASVPLVVLRSGDAQ